MPNSSSDEQMITTNLPFYENGMLEMWEPLRVPLHYSKDQVNEVRWMDTFSPSVCRCKLAAIDICQDPDLITMNPPPLSSDLSTGTGAALRGWGPCDSLLRCACGSPNTGHGTQHANSKYLQHCPIYSGTGLPTSPGHIAWAGLPPCTPNRHCISKRVNTRTLSTSLHMVWICSQILYYVIIIIIPLLLPCRESYIVGTTNPFLKEKCGWEVLADLETGKISLASQKLELILTGQLGTLSQKDTR